MGGDNGGAAFGDGGDEVLLHPGAIGEDVRDRRALDSGVDQVDLATPYPWAEALAEQLDSGRLLT